MSVKPKGLLGDIKTANGFHHSVKAKILYLHFILSSKYQILIAHITSHFHVI